MPEKYNSAEAMRLLRERRRREGLCIGCGEALDYNRSKSYCLDCILKMRRRTNARNQYYADQGYCPKCREPLDRDGYLCSKCNGKQAINIKRYKNKWLEQGICPRCTKNKVIEGLKYCYECQKIETTQAYHKRLKKKMLLSE